MSTYIFILGKDRELSTEEIKAVFPKGKMNEFDGDFLILEVDEKIDQKVLDRLGGTIKIGEVKGVCSKEDLLNTIFVQLEDFHESGKLNYGLSLHGIPERNLRTLLLDLKKKLKKEGVSSRFANQNFKNISTAQYKGLKGKGIEIIVAKSGNDFVVSEVIAVQDIDAYSKRDYKKPFRDMKVGMLPPKLAQIMINLAGDVETIWDPFCGGGVLVMEGVLMGKKMFGSDINENTLEGADRNIEWLKKEFGVSETPGLYVHDATLPQTSVKFDAIVFEGYLGPPQLVMQSSEKVGQIVAELNKLYYNFFNSIKEIGFKGPIIAALPFFRIKGGGDLNLSKVIKEAESMGFQLKDRPLRYARHDQVVGREVYRFNCK